MKYFSMFSGIGGFEYGLQQAEEEFECIGYSEIDKYARSIYEKHYPNHTGYGDATKIRTEELPDFELLVGGFPCQAFSIAGKTRLDVDETRVDLSDEFNPDYNCEAFDFVIYAKNKGWKYDTIILDPPYSLRKSMEKYNGKICSTFVKIKEELPYILEEGGKIISFGYTSVCMGKVRGFKKSEICLVCHSGSHHDTVCVVEEMEK